MDSSSVVDLHSFCTAQTERTLLHLCSSCASHLVSVVTCIRSHLFAYRMQRGKASSTWISGSVCNGNKHGLNILRRHSQLVHVTADS